MMTNRLEDGFGRFAGVSYMEILDSLFLFEDGHVLLLDILRGL